MIENFTIQDIAMMLSTATSISEEKRMDLLNRLAEECSKKTDKGTILSGELTNELISVFEAELHFIEDEALVDQEEYYSELESEYADELASIAPQLENLVSEYGADVEELQLATDKEFYALDKQLDLVAQTYLKAEETSEIASIKKKLSKKSK